MLVFHYVIFSIMHISDFPSARLIEYTFLVEARSSQTHTHSGSLEK